MKKVITEDERYILDIHTHNPYAGTHSIINYDLLPVVVPLLLLKSKLGRLLGNIIFIFLNIFYWLVACSDPVLKGCSYSVGIHPWDALSNEMLGRWKMFKRMVAHEQVVAIGEAGLDKQSGGPLDIQLRVFLYQAQYSEKYGKPLIIHCVKAMEELLDAKKKVNPQQPWIWHGFRGKPEQAKQLLNQGFYLSFGEHYSEEAMAIVPDDRLFLETDESELDIETLLQRAAAVRGVEVEALRETIHKNVQNVFFKS